MKRTLIHDLLQSPPLGQTICIKGWVRTKRDSKGGFSFVEINDGSTIHTVQIIADAKLFNYEDSIKHIRTGAAVAATGEVKASPGKGQSVEIHAEALTVLGNAGEDYPLPKGRISMETLRTVPHFRVRTNTVGAVMRLRNCLAFAIHRFFQERRFNYLHTPIITGSDCEGAGAMFQVTTLDLESSLPQTDEKYTDFSKDFFKKKAHLTVSGQLEGETYAMGLGQIYTFGPTFRAENSNTPNHLAEFWMVEPEVAFNDIYDNMDLAEDFVRFTIRAALEECPDDMAFFDKRVSPGLLENLKHIVETSFERLTYTEAIDILKAADKDFEFPVEWGMDLQREHERFLAEDQFKKPVILYNYPASIKPFYMYLNDDGGDKQTVRAMDVLLPGVGEIIGGSEREVRPDLLHARMEASGLDLAAYQWYIDLRLHGSAPHAGFGLGFERLVQFVSGMANIRDVIAYPRAPGHL